MFTKRVPDSDKNGMTMERRVFSGIGGEKSIQTECCTVQASCKLQTLLPAVGIGPLYYDSDFVDVGEPDS